MLSPFPGMDPYLEAPDIWPDLHDRLATQVSALLNETLPRPYYARLEMRPEVGIVEDGGYTRRIVPDVAVVRPPQADADAGGVAVQELPRAKPSKSLTITVRTEPIRHAFVEIRDPTRRHHLVTLLEIISPSNKRFGPDRRTYLLKQREVLESSANLIELDLLRGGIRPQENAELIDFLANLDPHPDYLVLVNRAWPRLGTLTDYELYLIPIMESLPCISVPLRQGQDEIPLDLQYVFNRTYESGPYRRGAVDYEQPPHPPLEGETAAWAEQRLREAGLRAASAS